MKFVIGIPNTLISHRTNQRIYYLGNTNKDGILEISDNHPCIGYLKSKFLTLNETPTGENIEREETKDVNNTGTDNKISAPVDRSHVTDRHKNDNGKHSGKRGPKTSRQNKR
jgi:hypothetical protein